MDKEKRTEFFHRFLQSLTSNLKQRQLNRLAIHNTHSIRPSFSEHLRRVFSNGRIVILRQTKNQSSELG